MNVNERPDPDALLAAIKRDEERSRKGKLFLFLGMAPGVGKTFAMLETAHQLVREGIDVVVGVVETHGRLETQALIEGLEVLPRTQKLYREAHLNEMDLDAVLARKPRVVLVDELAHANIPGSRHAKRWQDVFEILDSGIDVLSTINVQHFESRKDVVEQIAGIKVRESVPDTIIDRAFKIRLIDIGPDDLLKRLKEGKVYLGDKAGAAAENFFKEDKLTALRELALRLTAEKVDYELQSFRTQETAGGPWQATERLMVAVSHSPYSERLIRAARRIAFNLDAPWIAAHIDSGLALSEDDEKTLKKNINLARDLGGEVVTTVDPDIVFALTRIARQKNVTQLIVGRPARRLFKDFVEGGTLLDQLVREGGELDIHVLRQESTSKRPFTFFSNVKLVASLGQYAQAFWMIAIAAGINKGLVDFVGYRAVGFIFLLSILLLGFFESLGPVLFAAILSALVWDYFFIPPVGNWSIRQPEDIFMCLAYLLVALTTGTLTRRIRSHEVLLQRREERASTLYEIVRDIGHFPDTKEMLDAVNKKLGIFLKGHCAVSLRLASGELEPFPGRDLGWLNNDKEMAVARWVLDNKKHAGWSTDTLSGSEALYIPLKINAAVFGVMAFRPSARVTFTREDENFLFTVCRQLAVFLDREGFREIAGEALRLEQSEKLHQTILNSVSHEIRTPLTAIVGLASALADPAVEFQASKRDELTEELVSASERLNHVVENLLDMSRLSSGILTLKKDWHDIRDVISIALETLKKTLSDHPVEVKESQDLPLIKIDIRLFEQALSNLLINAATYCPKGSKIFIDAGQMAKHIFIKVRDQGHGIPDEALPRIFDKFFRVPGSKPGGTGLGLTIAKSIIEAHGGTIEVRNARGGGAEFEIILNVEEQPRMPEEQVK